MGRSMLEQLRDQLHVGAWLEAAVAVTSGRGGSPRTDSRMEAKGRGLSKQLLGLGPSISNAHSWMPGPRVQVYTRPER